MTRISGTMQNWGRIARALLALTAVSTAACGSSTTANGPTGSGGAAGAGGPGGAAGGTGAAGLPPMGAAAVEAWLQTGQYKNWHCEPAVHAARSPSPHGFNRICSNDVIAAHATETAAWLEGAAAVKELYAAAGDTSPIGYAVYAKLSNDSAAGANWYWYERVPLDSEAPHDAAGVVADGMGSTGPAMKICVGCHGAAGADAPHTPSVGGRDQVYTPVK